MNKIKEILDAFYLGHELANSVSWKRGAVLISVFVPLILSIFELTGYKIDKEAAGTIALNIVSIINIFVHIVSSSKLGIPGKNKIDTNISK